MKENLEILKEHRIFSGLSREIIGEKILTHGRIKRFAEGEYVIHPQDEVDEIGIVLEGELHNVQIFFDGNYSLMDVLEPSYVVAADLICTESRLSPYFIVAKKESSVMFLPSWIFLTGRVLSEQERLSVMNGLLTFVSHENMRRYFKIAILSKKGLRDRIMTYLSMQSVRQGVKTFKIPFSRETLAAFLCVNRSALSHELSLMEQEGLISFRKNEFTILVPMEPDGINFIG